jgi:uncharacterized protein (DUF2252 family)
LPGEGITLDVGAVTIVSTAISTVGAIGIAYIGVTQKRTNARSEKREALKAEGALIQMEMTQALLKLSKVTAKAVRQQKLNGDVEEAEEWVRRVEIKYAEYMRRVSQEVVG